MAGLKGDVLGAMFSQFAQNALASALSAAKGDALKNVAAALSQAREGSLRLLLIFRTPDGKVEHVRILMDREEAMAACKTAWKAMKEEK
jgi:hypothetical protein